MLHSQTKHKDLNSEERVRALYAINEQKKAYRKMLDQLTEKYNKDAQKCIKDIDSLNQITIRMGQKSKKFVPHILDLQAGLLSALKKMEELEKDNIKLEAKKKKFFGVGFQVGAAFIISENKASPYVGAGVSWNPLRF